MLNMEQREAFEREWTAIHAELDRLADRRPLSDPLATGREPTAHEQTLLGRLDEIEYLLGIDDLEYRRKCSSSNELRPIRADPEAQELRDKKT